MKTLQVSIIYAILYEPAAKQRSQFYGFLGTLNAGIAAALQISESFKVLTKAERERITEVMLETPIPASPKDETEATRLFEAAYDLKIGRYGQYGRRLIRRRNRSIPSAHTVTDDVL